MLYWDGEKMTDDFTQVSGTLILFSNLYLLCLCRCANICVAITFRHRFIFSTGKYVQAFYVQIVTRFD
jgi:hypothetical protein